MSQQRFDAYTRQAAMAISRRKSLLAAGGAGAALATLALATLAQASLTTAKKGGKRKKKNANRCCARQKAPCRAFYEEFCQGDVDCEIFNFGCCDLLSRCDVAAAIECIRD